MNFLAKCIGGSRMYNLHTEYSDIDYRGVYVNDDIGHILGLGKDHLEAKIEKNPEEKTEGAFFELRHFLSLLRKTNTMVLEILFNKNWVEKTPVFDFVLHHKYELLDTDRFYKSLCGYMLNESRLSFGERTGTLGSQRKVALEKYGYSPKNVVNLLRLCRAGEIFFFTGEFPLTIDNEGVHGYLMDIKQNPAKHTIPELKVVIDSYQQRFELAYKNKKVTYTFDESVANSICRKIYSPYI